MQGPRLVIVRSTTDFGQATRSTHSIFDLNPPISGIFHALGSVIFMHSRYERRTLVLVEVHSWFARLNRLPQ